MLQKDAKKQVGGYEPAPSNRAFPLFLKERALKILSDYHRSTKRGWHKIRNEIIEVTDAPETDSRPLLVRQDLESWYCRKSVIGDEKFKWVYWFLLSDAANNRPELAHSRSVLLCEEEIRIGDAINSFYQKQGDKELPRYLPPFPMGDLYNGVYLYTATARDHEIRRILTLHQVEDRAYFFANIIQFAGELSEYSDWDIISRKSGYCTFGQVGTLHLRDESNPFAETAIIDDPKDRPETLTNVREPFNEIIVVRSLAAYSLLFLLENSGVSLEEAYDLNSKPIEVYSRVNDPVVLDSLKILYMSIEL